MTNSVSIACPILTVVLPAVAVWIVVRFVNRQKKKLPARFWIKAGLVAVVVGYPLGFGPGCWLHYWTGAGRFAMAVVYRPLCFAWEEYPDLGTPVLYYARLGVRSKAYLNWDRDKGPSWVHQP